MKVHYGWSSMSFQYKVKSWLIVRNYGINTMWKHFRGDKRNLISRFKLLLNTRYQLFYTEYSKIISLIRRWFKYKVLSTLMRQGTFTVPNYYSNIAEYIPLMKLFFKSTLLKINKKNPFYNGLQLPKSSDWKNLPWYFQYPSCSLVTHS